MTHCYCSNESKFTHLGIQFIDNNSKNDLFCILPFYRLHRSEIRTHDLFHLDVNAFNLSWLLPSKWLLKWLHVYSIFTESFKSLFVKTVLKKNVIPSKLEPIHLWPKNQTSAQKKFGVKFWPKIKLDLNFSLNLKLTSFTAHTSTRLGRGITDDSPLTAWPDWHTSERSWRKLFSQK